MQPLLTKIKQLTKEVEAAVKRLEINEKLTQQSKLEAELAKPDAWSDSSAAQNKSRKLASLKSSTEPWENLRTQLKDLVELTETGDDSLKPEVEDQLKGLQSEFKDLKKQLQFRGKYDDHNVILRLSAGVGGTDAQDWTEMLERMYLCWVEKSGLRATILEQFPGEEAGIKGSVIEISGPYAYGKLKGEHGVHRLVRLSPFNADNLRQTSFALVEVLPQIDTPDEIKINDKDIKIDVFRAGGHGGQSVNTTDSAVRITHLPTGITVSIQNERSQLQNKETALKVLRSKLAQLQLEQHAESLEKLKGPTKSAEWGAQIRNYVLHPYTLVKDTRTKYEERSAQEVLDGKIDGFISAYLESTLAS